VPAYGPQNDVTLKMPAFEWVHVQLHQQKGMISLSPPTICNSAVKDTLKTWGLLELVNSVVGLIIVLIISVVA
ncbi:GntT/GntP/DsdX family permease, partial [Escherichia coli]|uniref:GntT/GntP/DsdX family permease n=1 Tax=Escherichia coli TaxID=562 RepID=UPI0020B1FB27